MLFTTAQTNPEIRARLQPVIGAGTGHLARDLEARRDAGELREDLDADMAAFAFLSPLFLFFLVQWDLPDAECDEHSGRFVKSLVTTWVKGDRVGR